MKTISGIRVIYNCYREQAYLDLYLMSKQSKYGSTSIENMVYKL